MDVQELQSRIEGKVTIATDAGYEHLRREIIWKHQTPARYPQLVVQVATEHDVIEVVRFARANRMKIAVRGGGHSWVGFSLRDGSVLIDLGRLDQIAIDREARTAAIQPAVTGRVLNRQLAAHGLAFPVGHCPTVPLSGFLLNGGLGWNFNGWGPACFSVEAANVVTADGKLAVANQEHHADLLWAIRGAGAGLLCHRDTIRSQAVSGAACHHDQQLLLPLAAPRRGRRVGREYRPQTAERGGAGDFLCAGTSRARRAV
jgi:FAD/FMN-containing dehydrogenase